MAEQETLGNEQTRLNPLVHSLWARFVDGDHINRGAWIAAYHEGGFVGDCSCGDKLVPALPDPRGGYEAHCRGPAPVHKGGQVTGCGKTVYAPGGRLGKPAKGGAHVA